MLESQQIYQKPSITPLVIYLQTNLAILVVLASISAYGKKTGKKNTTIGSPSSDLRNILFYISKWSSFSSVSFVIFSFDLPYTCSDLDNAIYADDTIPYEFRQNSTGTIGYLEPTINKIFAWLKHNRLLAELCYAFMLQKFD